MSSFGFDIAGKQSIVAKAHMCLGLCACEERKEGVTVTATNYTLSSFVLLGRPFASITVALSPYSATWDGVVKSVESVATTVTDCPDTVITCQKKGFLCSKTLVIGNRTITGGICVLSEYCKRDRERERERSTLKGKENGENGGGNAYPHAQQSRLSISLPQPSHVNGVSKQQFACSSSDKLRFGAKPISGRPLGTMDRYRCA